jgi:hypothetical protein
MILILTVLIEFYISRILYTILPAVSSVFSTPLIISFVILVVIYPIASFIVEVVLGATRTSAKYFGIESILIVIAHLTAAIMTGFNPLAATVIAFISILVRFYERVNSQITATYELIGNAIPVFR